jgi:hypothetical protein
MYRQFNLHEPYVLPECIYVSQYKQRLFPSGGFLGKFAKLPKATITFVVSACLSVHPSAWYNWAPSGRVLKNLILVDFSKISEEN